MLTVDGLAHAGIVGTVEAWRHAHRKMEHETGMTR